MLLGLGLLGPECLGQAAVKNSRGKEGKKQLPKELCQEERREGSFAASPASWLWAKVSLLPHHRLRSRKGQAPDPCGSEEGVQRQGEMAGLAVSSSTSACLSVRREHWARRSAPGSALICHLWPTLTRPGPQQNMRSLAVETEISPSGQILCWPLPGLISDIQCKAPALQPFTEEFLWEALPVYSSLSPSPKPPVWSVSFLLEFLHRLLQGSKLSSLFCL